MKQKLIRLTESDLHNIVRESAFRMIKEGDLNSYYMPNDINKLEDYRNGIMDYINASDESCETLMQAVQIIDNFIEQHHQIEQ